MVEYIRSISCPIGLKVLSTGITGISMFPNDWKQTRNNWKPTTTAERRKK